MALWGNLQPGQTPAYVPSLPNLRFPDYISANVNAGGLIGWTGQVTLDRYGNLYIAPFGGNVGKSLSIISGSLTPGWINDCDEPSEEQLKEFSAGHSFNAGAGYGGGGGQTWVPGVGTATELGLVTPQLGVSYSYSFYITNIGLEW